MFYAVNGFALEQFEDHCFYVLIQGGPFDTVQAAEEQFPPQEFQERVFVIVNFPIIVQYEIVPQIKMKDGKSYIKVLDRHRNPVSGRITDAFDLDRHDVNRA